jgi:hypothetical protein
MARLSPNPDRDFSAGYEKRDPEIDRLLAEPPLPWDDMLDDPVIPPAGREIDRRCNGSVKEIRFSLMW